MTATTPARSPLLLTVREAADQLRCTTWHTYRLIQEGLLPCVRLGGRALRIDRRALEDFVTAGGTAGAAAAAQPPAPRPAA